eukprot:scaffold71811_cov66-Phaeocystis_antarctica.AAC.2
MSVPRVVPMSCPDAQLPPSRQGGSADVDATRHCRSERGRSRGRAARAAPVVLSGGAARGGGRRQ